MGLSYRQEVKSIEQSLLTREKHTLFFYGLHPAALHRKLGATEPHALNLYCYSDERTFTVIRF